MFLNQEQQKLVDDNEKLIYYIIARKYTVEPRDYEDVCQVGMMGLCKAAITYDSRKKVAFSTYAASCIMNEIKMYYRKENRLRTNCISIDAPYTLSDKSGEASAISTVGERLADDRNYFDELIEREEFVERINIVLNKLSFNETTVALLFLAELKQREMRAYLNVSRAYICDIVQNVKKKLKKLKEQTSKKVSGKYEFSLRGEFYCIKINCGETLTQEQFLDICQIVKMSCGNKSIIRKTSGMVEIITLRDSSFFEMLAKINIMLK